MDVVWRGNENRKVSDWKDLEGNERGEWVPCYLGSLTYLASYVIKDYKSITNAR